MTSTIAPEIVLAGRYRLVHRLASGGMGHVWRAADEVLERPVAVKLLRSEYAEDPTFLDRFRTEARCTAALSHPGIANVFDYGEVDGPDSTAYLVMELVEGAPLSELLAREGRLEPERTLDLVAQAALALGSAHEAGVVHRDVKPSNLLIRRDGVVKVTDFGISRNAGESPRTETGVVIGTAAYLSPEQVACLPATPASDVYALGVVTYECLAGRRPFTGEHPVALALAHQRHRPPPLPADVPEPVRALVDLAMAKDPRVRPPNATALARHLLRARAALIKRRRRAAAATPTPNGTPGRSGTPSPNGDPAHDAAARANGTPSRGGALSPNGATGANGAVSANGAAGGGALSPNGAAGADGAVANGYRPRHGGRATVTDPEQDTGEWAPASLRFTRAWVWSRQRQRPLAVVALMAVLALLAAAVTVAATAQRAPSVKVPSVEGLPIRTAGQVLTRAGFEVRERARPDRFTEAGTVLAQDPAAGVQLPKGGLVTLTVSTGPASVVVEPARYLGKPLDTVRAALIRLGLQVRVRAGPANGEPGTVIDIDPSGALRQGDAVTLTVVPSTDPNGSDAGAAPASSGQDDGSGQPLRGHAKKGKHGGNGKSD
jgi:hypothetical protein